MKVHAITYFNKYILIMFFILVNIILIIPSIVSAEVLILSSTPKDEVEYKNIFHNSPVGKQLSDIHDLKNIKFKNEVKVNNNNDLYHEITKSKLEYIILIGHNSDGDFYFPSGDLIKINEIDNLVIKNNKYIIYLSCKAQDHTDFPATKFVITYSAAYKLAKVLEQSINKNFQNFEVPLSDPFIPLSKKESSPVNPETPFIPLSSTLNKSTAPKRCVDVLNTTQKKPLIFNRSTQRQSKRLNLDSFIKSKIRHEEINGILASTPVKLTLLSAATGIYGITVDSDD